MALLDPIPPKELPELADLFETVAAQGGRVPNMYLTMARHPAILRGFAALGQAVMGPGSVPAGLKALVGFVASNTNGCRFCSTHTSRQAFDAQVPIEKIALAFEYQDHPDFSPSERAALRLARDSALHPPEVGPGHFEELRRHFSDQQIVELLAVSCLFAFANRWHEVIRTELEPGYESFISEHLAPHGWAMADAPPSEPGPR